MLAVLGKQFYGHQDTEWCFLLLVQQGLRFWTSCPIRWFNCRASEARSPCSQIQLYQQRWYWAPHEFERCDAEELYASNRRESKLGQYELMSGLSLLFWARAEGKGLAVAQGRGMSLDKLLTPLMNNKPLFHFPVRPMEQVIQAVQQLSVLFQTSKCPHKWK